MYKKFILFLLIIFTSTVLHSREKFQCGDEINLDNLYSIKRALNKENFESIELKSKYEIVRNNKTTIYSNFYTQCFEKQLSISDISTYSSIELHRLTNLLLHLNFYSPKLKLIDSVNKIKTVKEAWGDYVDNLIISLHEVYIRSRYIDRAIALVENYPHIEFSKTYPLTEKLTMKEKTSYLKLNNQNKSISHIPFYFPKGGFVIVVSSPLCSPSNRFINWLIENKKMKSRFISNSLFITPSDSSFYINDMVKINNKMNPLSMVYSINQTDWSESINFWNTPTLYFYYDGALRSQLIGWPKNGRAKELTEKLENIGL